jgi:hypothetical protein
MKIETEMKIKNDLLAIFNNLEEILKRILEDTHKIAKEYHYIDIKSLKVNLKIPVYTDQIIVSEYEFEFRDKENNVVAKYKGGKRFVWADSLYRIEGPLESDSRYSYLHSPPKKYLDNFYNYLQSIAISIGSNYTLLATLRDIKRDSIRIEAKLYIDKNTVSPKIVFIKKNQEKNQEIIEGIRYYNNKTEITVYL